MLYLEQFIDALKFLRELEPDPRLTDSVLENAKQIFMESAEDPEHTALLMPVLEAKAREFIEHSPQNLAHMCHAISDVFHHNISAVLGSAITIGTVSFLDESIYEVTRDSIKNILSRGVQPGEPLNLHVWLTFQDMTVLDLTIIPTLIDKGVLSKDFQHKPYVIWREGQSSPFKYTPLLQHNEFAALIDNISIVTYPYAPK